MTSQLLQHLRTRPLYLWGAGQQGRGLWQRLRREGIDIQAFIDESAPAIPGGEVLGRPVLTPGSVLAQGRLEDPPVIAVTPFFAQEQILARAEAHGFTRGRTLFALADFSPYLYVIDISGICNLRCLSCPRGEGRRPDARPGFMSPAVFTQVADKIRREDPLAATVQLYQWGEPLLNRELPEMIRLANERRLAVALSSNLNVPVDLKPIIAAGPSWFRVSLSGFGPGYEVTHTGGRWPVFLENLKTLSRLKKTLNPAMKVEVFYHLYKHNQGEELQSARRLCEELGFELDLVWAYLISLDEIMAWREGGALPEAARRAADLLAIAPETALAKADAEKALPCLVKNVIPINWDLSVRHCMMFYYRQGNLAADNFLEHSLPELQEIRREPPLCRRCRRLALHRYCQVYNTWSCSDS